MKNFFSWMIFLAFIVANANSCIIFNFLSLDKILCLNKNNHIKQYLCHVWIYLSFVFVQFFFIQNQNFCCHYLFILLLVVLRKWVNTLIAWTDTLYLQIFVFSALFCWQWSNLYNPITKMVGLLLEQVILKSNCWY